jgi:hypothetical protein
VAFFKDALFKWMLDDFSALCLLYALLCDEFTFFVISLNNTQECVTELGDAALARINLRAVAEIYYNENSFGKLGQQSAVPFRCMLILRIFVYVFIKTRVSQEFIFA